ncbi:gastric triacylglycerol lipase [Parasteatoda tepidariorum]|uniref:gastric triacylglycerol lipase n=1 Tax=Parasteatoda tepidariorum TaxID=114398 RepID=UPI00077F918E|nr:gastric triacylglycerol lipase [Parasteatoda tepidariorum]
MSNMRAFLLLLCLAQLYECSIDDNLVFDPDNFINDLLGIGQDPDMKLNVTELISSKGYPVEEYIVQTRDGYLLGVQRIPRKGKKVVFLQHGLLSSSTDWVINFPQQSLAYILADAGYDVWLGNIRGNTYSRKHVKYSPKSREFWDFSFDEMAEYDLPAMIDFALNVSGQNELYLIGHSQGTTTSFALLSSKPEYNKKVKLFIGLAPVTTVGYITTAIRYIAPLTKELDILFELVGWDEFLPNDIFMKWLSQLVCDTKLKFVCEDVIFLVCGTDYSQLNKTRLGVYVHHTPAGSSTRSVVHYGQMVNSKKFLKYDYGKKKNLLHYNQTTPPEYFTENITTNVALFWSVNDKLADPQDVHLLEGRLKTLVSSIRVNSSDWNHLDFVWGLDARSLVYEGVLSLLQKFIYT